MSSLMSALECHNANHSKNASCQSTIKMAGNDFYQVLKPILLLSKFSGTLPLNFEETPEGKVLAKRNRFCYLLSFFYSLFNVARDFKYVRDSFVKQVKRLVPARVLVAIGDFTYNAFVISLYTSTWARVKYFPVIFEKFGEISLVLSLKSPKRIRNIIVFLFLSAHFMDTYKFMTFFVKSILNYNVSLSSALLWLMSYFSLINLNVNDFEFWGLCFVIYQYLKALNEKLEGIWQNVSIGELEDVEITRPIVCNLIDISELVNSLYGTCLLCSLSMRCIYLQHDGFLCIKNYYDTGILFSWYIFKYGMWFIIHFSRCLILIWVCNKVKNEVRYIKIII